MQKINITFLLLMSFLFLACVEKKEEMVKPHDSKAIVLKLKQVAEIYYNEALRHSPFSKKHKIEDKEIDLEVPYIYLNKLKERVFVTSISDSDKARIRYTVNFILHRDSYKIRKAYFTKFSPDENYYAHNKGVSVYNDFTGIAEMYLPDGDKYINLTNILDGERVRLLTNNDYARKSDIELPEIIIIGDRGIWCPICGTEVTNFYPSLTSCPVCDYCFTGSCGGGGSPLDGGIDPGTGGGGGGGTPAVVVNSEGEKIDPKEETKCFDLAQGATLTVYVQQADPNTRSHVGPRQVGHVFIGIEQNGITRYLGYYPPESSSNVGIAVGRDYQGEIRDNSGFSPYDVSISTPINNGQLTEVVNYINNYPKTYNLNNYACADFGIAVAEKGGLKLPVTRSSDVWFKGLSPGNLGEDIRAMTPPSGVSINKTNTPKQAPNKKGGC